MIEKAIKDLRLGLGLYHVWLYQSYHELSAKYKRTFLGSLWISGSMVFTSVAIAIMFGALFRQSLQQMLPYVMAGNLAASLCLMVLNDAPELFMATAGIIKNHAYPFTYYAFERVSRAVILFFHNLVVFYIAAVLVSAFAVPHWTLLPGLAVVIVVCLAWSMLTGMLAARFRDMRYFLPYVGTLLFFITPIYWRLDTIKGDDWRRQLALDNPIYCLVQLIREPLLGKEPNMADWISALIVMISGIILWLVFFSIYRRRIPFWV